MQYSIRFNVPNRAPRELDYVADVIDRRHLAGKGYYNQQCKNWLTDKYGWNDIYLTPSCTDALEMAAILCNIGVGDEVVVPSYTFVSTANAFATRGAKVRFADSRTDDPNVDVASVAKQITAKTKAIVAVHYGGFSCDLQSLRELADSAGVYLIEDAACALGSTFNGQPVGSIGDLAAFSFHETKNITCGKGGAVIVNNTELASRAPQVWEKGTDRAAYFKGEVDKYGWVDFGSSFMMTEIAAAFLYAQMDDYANSSKHRNSLWSAYHDALGTIKAFKHLPMNEHNAHCFYGICNSEEERDGLINYLKEMGVQAVFHYQALHNSTFSQSLNGSFECVNADRYERCLIRFPLHNSMNMSDVKKVCDGVKTYFASEKVT